MTNTRKKIAGAIKAGIIAVLTFGTAAFGAANTANAFTTAPSGLNTLSTTTTVEQVKFRGGRRGGFRGHRGGFRGGFRGGHRGFRGGHRGFRSGFRGGNRGFRGGHRGFNRGFKRSHRGFKSGHRGFKSKNFGFKKHGFKNHHSDHNNTFFGQAGGIIR